MVTVQAQDLDSGPPLSTSSKVAIVLLVVVLVLAAAIGFWKFWYCPGPLGRFHNFRCVCAPNAQKNGRRCTCSQDFLERGGACQPCGAIGQPCCPDRRCSYDPSAIKKFVCGDDGLCHEEKTG